MTTAEPAEPLDLLDIASVLARASEHVPDGARVWVQYDGIGQVTISATHHGVAAQIAGGLDLPRQHPPRNHVELWARGVNANGKHAVLAVEFIDTQRITRIWGQETAAA